MLETLIKWLAKQITGFLRPLLPDSKPKSVKQWMLVIFILIAPLALLLTLALLRKLYLRLKGDQSNEADRPDTRETP